MVSSVRHFILLFACSILASLASPAISSDLGGMPIDETAPIDSDNSWDLRFTPYAWLPWIKGDVNIKGQQVNVDANIFNIIDDSDSIVPWMSYLEARKGRFSGYLDAIYAKLKFSGGDVRQTNPIPGLSVSVGAAAGVKYKFGIIEAGAAYELSRVPSGNGMTAFDIYAGGRYWYQNMELDLAVSGTVTTPRGFTRTANLVTSGKVTADWIDPLIGLRMRHSLAPGKEIVVKGDIGGFGAGSDFSYNLLAAYTWEFSDRWGVTWAGAVGYRALYADYSEGAGTNKFTYDLLWHGPTLGLSMRF